MQASPRGLGSDLGDGAGRVDVAGTSDPRGRAPTFSTSVGLASVDDSTPDTTPQNTLITMVSSGSGKDRGGGDGGAEKEEDGSKDRSGGVV